MIGRTARIGRLVGVLVAGCTSGTDAPDLMDTGWFPPATGTDGVCTARLHGSSPAEGETGWYWRDWPQIEVVEVSDVYSVRLTDDLGRIVPTRLEPANEAGLVLDVVFDGGLWPSTSFVLEITDCAATTEVHFTTSELGRPVAGGVASLTGNTYELLLDDPAAEWVQPGGLGTILGSFFNTPILLGVQWADARGLDWIGATGFFSDGQTWQDTDYPTWSFPVSDFSGAPYFATTASQVDLVVGGYELPIYGFSLQGTFAADGQRFAGAVLQGLGDTRYSGGALGQPANPAALCNLSSGIGVQCVACPDSEPLCLAVEVHNMTGRLVPGVTLDIVTE